MTDHSTRERIGVLLRRRASEARTEHPLSWGQNSLWLLHQFAPRSAAYNVAFAARFSEGFDPGAFHQALQSLVSRHAALRTTFGERAGAPFQTVWGWLAPGFEVVDATGWPEATLHEEARRRYALPFDIGAGPPIRAHVLRCGDSDAVVLLVMHHLVSDFWSLTLMLDELSALYQAEARRVSVRLSDRNVPYSDFVARQRAFLESDRGRAARSYWHQELAGELPVTQWPSFRTDTTDPDAGSSVRIRFERDIAAGLRELARNEGATPFMVALSTLQVMIHRYTGQPDVLIGSPVSGRTDPAFDECVGDFVDPVVLRASFADAPSFRTLLQRTKTAVAGALEYQEYPFELLVDELAPPRAPGVNPIFQAMFVYQRPNRFPQWAPLYLAHDPARTVPWGGLTLSPFYLPQQEGQLDLLLEIVEDADDLWGVLKYRTSVFSDDAARRAGEHYVALLRAVLDDPSRRVGELPLAPAAAHGAATEPDRRAAGDSVLRRFREVARAHSSEVAVRSRDEELTYGDLEERARVWAAELRTRGTDAGDRVALLFEPSLDSVVAMVACLHAGAVYVPLDVHHPPARIQEMLVDAGARAVLTTADVAARIGDAGVPLVDVTRITSTGGTPAEEAPPALDDVLYTIYTSGSTGAPKGIEIEHGNVLSLVDATHELSEPDSGAVWTLFHSVAFDFSVWEIWGALLTGGRLVVVPHEVTRAPDLFRSFLAAQNVTHMCQTPSALHGLAAEVAANPSPALSLRHTFSCGEMLPADLARRCLGWCGTLWNLYGPAETTVFVTGQRVHEEDCTGASVAVGTPLPGHARVRVLDPNRQVVPQEVQGEVYIGGLAVGRGYWNRPSLSAERFLDDPEGGRLYRTGDLGRVNADGSLEILGRVDNQVKISGFRVELEEIEATLDGEPGVARSAVFVEGDGAEDRRLVACVVPAASPGPDEGELRSGLAAKLPPYMVPSSFVLMDDLPLSTSRKVDRAALARRVREAEPQERPAAPRGLRGLEADVAAIWERVLRRGGVGPDDNFFDVGGNSMSLLRVHREVSELPGVAAMAVSEMFRYPTVAGLARRLGGGVKPRSAADPGQRRAELRRGLAGAGAQAAVRRDRRERLPERRGKG